MARRNSGLADVDGDEAHLLHLHHNGPANVHPSSQKLFRYVPFLEDVPVLGPALQGFSPRLIFSIGLERVFVKGLCFGLVRFSIQPMLTGRYGLSGAMYQRLASLYALGWSVNPFFSAIADTFAIFGYTKRWYCAFCGIGGGVFALLYALLPAKESSAKPAAGFLFLVALFLAIVDTFAQAIYTRRIRRNPEGGAALVSWAWGAAMFGVMISAAIQGPLTDNNLTNVGVYIVAGLFFLVSILFIFNLFGEQPNRIAAIEDAKVKRIAEVREAREAQQRLQQQQQNPSTDTDKKQEVALAEEEPLDEESDEVDVSDVEAPKVRSILWGAVEINLEVVTNNWLMIIYCCVLTAAVVVAAVVTILGTRWDLLYTSIAVTVVVCGAAFFTLPIVVAKTATFLYFNYVFNLSLPGVLNTFYVATPACLPDGPHFSYTFYNLITGIVGNVCGIVGVTIFAYCCQNCSYRGIMGASGIIFPIVALFDLILLKRWNTAIGIPDHAMYILGDGVIYETVEMILFMPAMLLMSRVSPRGTESMVLALLSSVGRVGSSTSSAIGYLLLETIWPVTTYGKCDYTNAPWLVIAGHIVLPLLIVPLAFLLLPASRVCATLDENGEEVEEIILSEVPKAVPEEGEVTAAAAAEEAVGSSKSSPVDQLSRVSVEEPTKAARA